MTREFVAWPKIARLNRDITITEKIDGTNACIVIGQQYADNDLAVDGSWYTIYAQSRTRVITPESDNFGFARWVQNNAETLIRDLGVGRHFGEWYGQGIQRKYNLDHKRFALFNTHRFAEKNGHFQTENLETVPIIYDGMFNQVAIDNCLGALRSFGSFAVPGFMDPEGIIVFHNAAHAAFKVTLVGDESPKSLA